MNLKRRKYYSGIIISNVKRIVSLIQFDTKTSTGGTRKVT